MFSQRLKMLSLAQYITYVFLSLDSFLVLLAPLCNSDFTKTVHLSPKLHYVDGFAWTLKEIQIKLAVLGYSIFIGLPGNNFKGVLVTVNLVTFYPRPRHLSALLHVTVL